ncbi:MAG: isoprenylcysteine carboxylmethyltransferase family protein [Chloroflexi bacterium]|nr:isoprenylcysteine carboxylmethyltransferase family protein [Chloroflexota bacterium]
MRSFIYILFTMAIYGAIHSLLATFKAKARAKQFFGQAAERGYRLFFNIFAVISLLPVLALPAILPDHHLYTISMPWMILFLIGQGIAAVAEVIGVLQTGAWEFLGLKQLFTPPAIDGKLAIRGLYHWVRHPLYSAGLLFIWLTPVMTMNILALNIGLTIYIIIGTHFEERRLCAEFGNAYESYKNQVPMLIPSIRIRDQKLR